MLRIVVETCCAAMAVNVGGSVERTVKTFDVDLPELESHIREAKEKGWTYTQRQVIGVEVLEDKGDD